MSLDSVPYSMIVLLFKEADEVNLVYSQLV